MSTCKDVHGGWTVLRPHLPSRGGEARQRTGLAVDALQTQGVPTMGSWARMYEAWWGIVCVHLAGPWGAQVLRETLLLGVAVRVFPGESNI